MVLLFSCQQCNTRARNKVGLLVHVSATSLLEATSLAVEGFNSISCNQLITSESRRLGVHSVRPRRTTWYRVVAGVALLSVVSRGAVAEERREEVEKAEKVEAAEEEVEEEEEEVEGIVEGIQLGWYKADGCRQVTEGALKGYLSSHSMQNDQLCSEGRSVGGGCLLPFLVVVPSFA